MKIDLISATTALALALYFCTVCDAHATEVSIETQVRATYLTNLFMDKSAEADLSITPSAALGLQFGDYWSLGYSGQLSTYVEHPELLLYFQNLYLNAQNRWGAQSENEFFSELSFGSMLNRNEYDELDLFNPRLVVDLTLEPKIWLRTHVGVTVEYRWFYHDNEASSIDTWVDGSLSFLSSRTRTTLSPKVAFGYRYYPEAQTSDIQPLVGAHLSQGLWDTGGMQADYSFRWTDEQNELLNQQLTSNQFFFVGEEFLYTGHHVNLGLKQLLGDYFTAQVSTSFEDRVYTSWEALDADGLTTGEYRRDLRLAPTAQLNFEKAFYNQETDRITAEIAVGLDYLYVKQWSNSDWYDTSGHSVMLILWGVL